jgi:hypothetical protein
MSDTNRSPDDDVAQGSPKDFFRPGDRRIITDIAALQAQMRALEESNERHHTDFRWTWGGLVAGFLLLAALFLYGYNRLEDRLDQKTTALLTNGVRVETKLDDLSQRLLPLPTLPRH